MAKPSTRTNSGLGGRPTGGGVRHNTHQSDTTVPEATVDFIPEETDDIREAIRSALVKNTTNIESWLSAVGIEDPVRALTLYIQLSEFVLPKLQRTDSKIDPSSPVNLVFETIQQHKERKQIKPKNDF